MNYFLLKDLLLTLYFRLTPKLINQSFIWYSNTQTQFYFSNLLILPLYNNNTFKDFNF